MSLGFYVLNSLRLGTPYEIPCSLLDLLDNGWSPVQSQAIMITRTWTITQVAALFDESTGCVGLVCANCVFS